MQVDPATGMPIDELDHGGTFSQDVVQGALEATGNGQGRFFAAAEHIPNTFQTVGWNAHRGANTITKGLKRGRFGGKPHGTGFVRGSIPATAHPSNWGRMATHSSLDAFDDASHTRYTPFQTLGGKHGNSAASWGIRKSKILESKGVRSRLHKYGIMNDTEMGSMLEGGKGPDMFSGGVYSRLSASAKIAGWGDTRAAASGKHAKNMTSFLKSTDTGLHSAAEGLYGKGLTGASRGELADLSAMSSRGRISQAVGGYMRGVSGLGERTSTLASGAVERKAFMGGARMAENHLADAGIRAVAGKLEMKAGTKIAMQLGLKGGEKVSLSMLGKISAEAGVKVAAKAGLAMGARAVGPFIPGVNVVMAAWTAYDMTKMGIELMKGGGELAVEGYKSFQGSLYKPTMGMGYKDTEVAATSRARGVLAIQNSRLNARSALGSEASAMANHFG